MTPTDRTELQRIAERGSRDWNIINAVLDAGFLAAVGFSVEAQPYVIPMLYGRRGRNIYLHGSAASRIMTRLETGIPVCVTVTLVDGLVLARSAFNHSMNYRSVVAFGVAGAIVDPCQKIDALRIISDHLIAGRWNDVRGPNKKELNATTVLGLLIDEASVKIRSGPPVDNQDDLAWPAWAGILPLRQTSDAPIPDAGLVAGIELPRYLLERSVAPVETPDRRSGI
jgi:nitroimidazol reductase NimA-like FMN-containing flavoprotein (pyridoxamine 5'-phosphate oxidase superfamily)